MPDEQVFSAAFWLYCGSASCSRKIAAPTNVSYPRLAQLLIERGWVRIAATWYCPRCSTTED